MHHYQNISYLVDAFNLKCLTEHFISTNNTQLNSTFTKLTVQQEIHNSGALSDGKIM